MTDFENKLVDILSKSANGKIEAVEYVTSNGESDKASNGESDKEGKVIQTVSFSYEIDEGNKD